MSQVVTPDAAKGGDPSLTDWNQPRHARRARVVNGILHAIFKGELAGGDRLVEEELGAKFGVSRTPVREGLTELAAIGVIWLKPNHGAMVRPFGTKQLIEIYQIRRVLEMEAARHAHETIDRERLMEIRERTQQLLKSSDRGKAWSEEALAVDQMFHEIVAKSSRSERLAEEIRRYWTLARSIGEAVGNAAYTQDHALVEHTAIMDCLLAHHADEAAEAMGRHLTRRMDAALVTICPPGSAPAPADAKR
ncbi:MAG: GntR family transcriptional regulator [Tepidisphaeraceae bacterium]